MNKEGEREHFQWLVPSVVAVAGEGTIAPSGKVEPVSSLTQLPAVEASRAQRWKRAIASCVFEEMAYRQGFLFVPVFIGGGAALWFVLPTTPSAWLIFLVTVFLSASAILLLYRTGLTASCVKISALFGLGMLIASWETGRVDTIILDSPVTTTLMGKVERREMDARGRWRYIIAVTATESPRLSRPPQQVSVLARSRHGAIPIGGMISGRARISPPSGPALPGLNDFAFSFFFNGIGATGFFYGAPSHMPQQQNASRDDRISLAAADAWLYALRSRVAERIRSVIGGDAGAFAASIVTDERRAISGETMEALRMSGLAHIVAISGLNMALASGIFFVGMRMAFSLFPAFSQRWPVKKISAFAALLMTFAYYLISGFAVSAERAWLMMSIMLIAVLLDQPSISLRNVALSAIVIIMLSPHEVMGPSFQMSFSATLALVAGFAFWSRWRDGRDRLHITRPPWWVLLATRAGVVMSGVAVTSLIGGLSTAIYSIEHFHRITTYGLAANLAATPVMSIIVMPFALVGMLLMPFGLDAPFLKVMGVGMAMVIDIAKTVSSWGGDAMIGRQNDWFLLVSTIGFLILTLLRTRLALFGLPVIAAGLLLVFAGQWQGKPDMMIYEDGSLVALLSPDGVATTQGRASGFVYDQWARAMSLPEKHLAPVNLDRNDVTSENAGDEAGQSASRAPALTEAQRKTARKEIITAFSTPGAFSCRKDMWCAARSRSGAKVVVVNNSGLAATACEIADIVVTSRFVAFQSCLSGALLLSRDTLKRTGSMEIWLDESGHGVAKATAAMNSVSRPWSLHRAYSWYRKDFDDALPEQVKEVLSR